MCFIYTCDIDLVGMNLTTVYIPHSIYFVTVQVSRFTKYFLQQFIFFLIEFLGVALTLFFFSKFLKLDDSMLGTISSIGRIVSGLICAFAPSVGLFYLGD